MKKLIVLFSILLIISFLSTLSFGEQTVPEEARRHIARGQAAMEIAKSPADLEAAVREFREAASLAPNWPNPHYNLGLVQEKLGAFKEAIASFKKYLQLAPEAPDAANVRELIYKLEYKAEQEITKEVALDIFGSLSDTTKWQFAGESSAYRNWVTGFRRDGSRILISYIYDIKKLTTFTASAELQGETFTLKYILCFFNFCGKDCDVGAQYTFEIVSKNKVQVKAVEVWPKIGSIEQEYKYHTFEYTRR